MMGVSRVKALKPIKEALTMKFTTIDDLNQRIDRISSHHAIIGIDMAKDIHVAQITDYRGRVLIKRSLSFTNTLEGFTMLLTWAHSGLTKNGLTSLLIGLEPTGHYWFNLANWLLEQGIEVVLVNPTTTHRNKENRDNSPSKNDSKDALTIADVVSRGFYTDYYPHADALQFLKTTVHDREYWSKQAISVCNRIVRWIDLYFPEFRRVFKDWTVPRSIASLRAFALPDDLKGRTIEQLLTGWQKQGMKRPGGNRGIAKAEELLAAAARSIGDRSAVEQAGRDLKRLLDAYAHFQQVLQDIEADIVALLGEIPLAEPLQSIHGLGKIPIAVVLGCAGDLSRYDHGKQLLRRAGLNLAECTSGKYKGQIKLAKRGDSMLRKYLYWAMLTLVSQHPDFKRWHAQNQAKGMKKQASIFKLIGKLCRILVGIAKRGTTYESPLIAGAAAA
jgi:transposase